MERLTRRNKEEGWVTVIGESDSLSKHIVKLCDDHITGSYWDYRI